MGGRNKLWSVQCGISVERSQAGENIQFPRGSLRCSRGLADRA